MPPSNKLDQSRGMVENSFGENDLSIVSLRTKAPQSAHSNIPVEAISGRRQPMRSLLLAICAAAAFAIWTSGARADLVQLPATGVELAR